MRKDTVVRLRYLLFRRMGPVGVVLTAWDLWRRLPPKQRQRIVDAARKHGPRVASRVNERRRRGGSGRR